MGVGGAPGERGGLLAGDPRELARRVPEICAGPRGMPNRQAREMSRPDSPEGWLAPGIVGTGRGRLGRFVGRVRGADFPGDSAGREEHEEREDPGDGHVRDPMQECNAEPDARDADPAHDDREPKRLPGCLSHLSMLQESDDLLWQRNERADGSRGDGREAKDQEYRIPALILIFGLPAIAAGTISALVSLPQQVVGFLKHRQMGQATRKTLRLAIIMGGVGIAGVGLGVALLHRITDVIVTRVLAFLMLLAAGRIAWEVRTPDATDESTEPTAARSDDPGR